MRIAAALLVCVLSVGCVAGVGGERLPTAPFRDDVEAVAILARRADAIATLSAQGTITLQRPDGESVRLDLAMVRSGRDKLRLRAWKLGRAVFDLTMDGGGVWLYTPEDASLKNKARSAGLTARRLGENIKLLSGELFHRDDLNVEDSAGGLQITAREGENTVRCDVDRRTLTPREYGLTDPAGVTRFALKLTEYRMLAGDVPFPFRLVATSADGKITLALREAEVNNELAEGAFVPPRRAEKLP